MTLLSRTVRAEGAGLLLLLAAVLFNGVLLAPELRIGRFPVNDGVFHLASAERMQEALATGEPFADAWVSEWGLGYPVWRSYQPLAHLMAAALLALPIGPDDASRFAAFQYLLLVLLPVSVYAGARLLSLPPVAAGLAAIAVGAPVSEGPLFGFGIGYGAQVWRGTGLFAHLVGLHCFVLGLGLVARALDTGRRALLAAAALAATALAHLVLGHALVTAAMVMALVGHHRGRRLQRLGFVMLGALPLVAWFALPFWLARGELAVSRWEPQWKWDAFGAPFVLKALTSGSLLDAGRFPSLTLLVAVALVPALLAAHRRRDAVPMRLLVLCAFFLAALFGRPTWGHLLTLAGIANGLPIHRLQAPLELCLVLLAAWGAAAGLSFAARRHWLLAAVVAVLLAAAWMPAARQSVAYLNENARWGEENAAALLQARSDIDAALARARELLDARPGRVSAGPAASWGNTFRVGYTPVFTLLTRAHLDQVSFLYHSMSRAGDVMVLRDETDPRHDALFGVRVVIAPVGQAVPPHLQPRGAYGPFAVYEASTEGYFGLVDVGADYSGAPRALIDAAAQWLQSPLLAQGITAEIHENAAAGQSWTPRENALEASGQPRGRIVREVKRGETYEAHVEAARACHALLKVSWHPDLRARVDGHPVRLLHVMPGFGAVPLAAGAHTVEVRYEPGPLKPVLFVAGLFAFAALGLLERRARRGARLEAMASRLRPALAFVSREEVRAALVLGVLALVALRPLFRGQLIDGHDSLNYPPRLVEMARALRDGHVPPLWAPDLGNGHGQPLFEFAPPLLYAVALPVGLGGASVADSLQVGLAILCLLGTAAMYALARRATESRAAALAAAAAWLFSPYLCLDLYVRAAMAETAAVAMAPCALWALLRALDLPSAARVAVGGLAVGLILLAHVGAALLLVPALAIVVAVRSAGAASGRRDAAVGAAVLAGALGLTAWFWVPALVEKAFVKTELLRAGAALWGEHILWPRQLLSGGWGFGLSVSGPGDELGFGLGPLHLALAAAGLWLGLKCRIAVRRREALAWAFLATSGAWLATWWAAGVWARVPALQYLAYPWRALLVPCVFLPLLIPMAVERLPAMARPWLIVLLVAANISHTEPKGYLTLDENMFAAASIAANGINTTTFEEYEPRWVLERPAYDPLPLRGVSAPVRIRSADVRSARQEFTLESDSPTAVQTSTFFFPGWSAYLDGRTVPLAIHPRFGTMAFDLPAGRHILVLDLEPTPLRWRAAAASLATLTMLALPVVVAFARRLRHRRRYRLGSGTCCGIKVMRSPADP